MPDILVGTSDDPVYVDAPVDFSYTTQQDETGNTIRFQLQDPTGSTTTVGDVSGDSKDTKLTVTKEPKDDLSLSGDKYFTLQVIRNPTGSDDTLDESLIYLTARS